MHPPGVSQLAQSCFQPGPAASAPLASHRCCQVPPGWSASQVIASLAPRNRQRWLPWCSTANGARLSKPSTGSGPVMGGRPVGGSQPRREGGTRCCPRGLAGLAAQLHSGRRGGSGLRLLQPGGHEIAAPNSTLSVSGR